MVAIFFVLFCVIPIAGYKLCKKIRETRPEEIPLLLNPEDQQEEQPERSCLRRLCC